MKYDPQIREYPAPTILKVIEIMKERKGHHVVEIGSCRMPLRHPLEELHRDCCLDSHSTAYWTKHFRTVSVDIDPAATQNTFAICKALKQEGNLIPITGDGVEYLETRDYEIDLLFLDAWDVNLPNSAEEHLRAFQTAERLLHQRSLVLIDDTDVDCVDGELVFSDGVSGKGKLVIPYAIENGWHVVFSGRQTLLSK